MDLDHWLIGHNYSNVSVKITRRIGYGEKPRTGRGVQAYQRWGSQSATTTTCEPAIKEPLHAISNSNCLKKLVGNYVTY